MATVAWIPIGIVIFVVLVFFMSGLRLIGPNEVGILTKKMFGKTMPEGQIIARHGEIGVQARTLMPGLYWRLPIVWSFAKTPVVMSIPTARHRGIHRWRALAQRQGAGRRGGVQSVPGCGDVPANHGKKGPQVGILRPGTYRINTDCSTSPKPTRSNP